MSRVIRLYLVRHGVAAERGEEWPDDTKRPLTDEGMTRMRRVARGFAGLDERLGVILTSPLVRTRQTADILAGAFTPTPPIVPLDALAPGGTLADVVSEISKHSRKETMALVGHEPSIGALAAILLGAAHPLEFKKGAIARIDVPSTFDGPPASGSLRWFLPPRVLRALRK